MVDLKGQYLQIKEEIDAGINAVIEDTRFINGPAVKEFSQDLATYLGVKHVVPCGNGTDALQIALMALGLEPGDEVITANFTFAATVEVIGLLNLKPVLVDVDPSNFTLLPELVEQAITPKTKAIIPVHLYGQCAPMEALLSIAEKHGIPVVEDTAQAIGSKCLVKGEWKAAGTMGAIGTTSFFPSKNLGCYGDGGAMFTNDDVLGAKLKAITNHGMTRKYYHDEIGVNSRLDTIQAAVLKVKLPRLDQYSAARKAAANRYNEAFADVPEITTPVTEAYSDHVFHQYTMKISGGKRDELRDYLQEHGVPSMVYYPVPLHRQKAYLQAGVGDEQFPNTLQLIDEVISLPMHTELDGDQQQIIIERVKSFFK